MIDSVSMSGIAFVILLVLALVGIVAVFRVAADRFEQWQYERSDPNRKHCGYHEAIDRIREALGYQPGHSHVDIADETIRRLRTIPDKPTEGLDAEIDAALVERVRSARSAVRYEQMHVVDRRENGDSAGLIEAAEHFAGERHKSLADAERLLQAFRTACTQRRELSAGAKAAER